ncbi:MULTISPECIES: ATP phosphoribosyltransferase regulatory subunit [Brevibacillus]|uniref:ATP phosphoribosyltransferase regulatory subunit n=1 Tax=Brevibacillus TaxID=55080 RepID=UPI000D0F65C7|nr:MULTISPECIES: ATP phosphoribosyltransferase regulatory subunit [Brevibacillus]MED1944638.1 ATP phosphoribosyltransferase regulatory subunit [Brevibacillus formosus]MED1996675.1 ATP phosphoribosyltransferase regulatory subunit [Brevibacillus formosus]MED2081644.1 ATP phosphoribosyltransferase regulatory subunit [Brevibacillus formosus]PSK12426.1 ATP phosphoribosyltransferase regulatory subunit [Brevibacillus sp. NRRL NRS-603]
MAKPLGFEKPLGMRDILPESLAKQRHLERELRQCIERWGYDEISTPSLEYFDTVGAASATLTDRMFRLLDKQGHTVVLRPDMTTPIARVVSSLYKDVPLPIRLYYQANVFRAQEKEAGRNAEFSQTGIELIGDASVDADAEAIALAVFCLRAAGVETFRIAIGHVDFVDGLLEEEIEDESIRNQFRQFLYERDFVGFRQLLATVDIPSEAKSRLEALLRLQGGKGKIEAARELAGNGKARRAVETIASLWESLEAYGVTEDLLIDFNLIINLNYYTGVVFEGYAADLGSPLLGGGRYDQLLSQFGRAASATGFAIKMDRLLQVTPFVKGQATARVLLVYTEDCRGAALAEAQQLREDGLVVVTRLVSKIDEKQVGQEAGYTKVICMTQQEE